MSKRPEKSQNQTKSTGTGGTTGTRQLFQSLSLVPVGKVERDQPGPEGKLDAHQRQAVPVVPEEKEASGPGNPLIKQAGPGGPGGPVQNLPTRSFFEAIEAVKVSLRAAASASEVDRLLENNTDILGEVAAVSDPLDAVLTTHVVNLAAYRKRRIAEDDDK